MLNEKVHDSRIIPIDGRPRPGIDSWTGESRGRWEDDTLVVETVDFSAKNTWRGMTPRRHLIERFTRVDEDTLLYEFTVTDPGTWAAPWTAQAPMRLNELPLFEYACHEGNYAMEGILAGARGRAQGGGAAAVAARRASQEAYGWLRGVRNESVRVERQNVRYSGLLCSPPRPGGMTAGGRCTACRTGTTAGSSGGPVEKRSWF